MEESDITSTVEAINEHTAPLINALKLSAQEDVAGFHFPGHNRGRAAPASLSELIGIRPFLHDLPELPELGNLFYTEGAVSEAQKQASKLFGSTQTWFLVGGTTSGIQAAIMATCSPGETLILPRNSHVSAISAIVLSGAQPKYIIPEYDSLWDVAGGVTPSQVQKAITETEMEGQNVAAVFVTSPTYNGVCSDLNGIARICHSKGIPLIVDEAHGAHLAFHSGLPNSALEQGADLVVQSTHKVLSSLSQSSMLHMTGDIVDRERIRKCLQTLQSTSPSYLLLASLDAARAQLSENPTTIFNKAVELAFEAKELISRIPGVTVLDFPRFSNFPAIDPLRVTIGLWQLGISGYKANEILRKDHGIIAELTGTRSLMFTLNQGSCREHVKRLVSGIQCLSTTFFTKNGAKVEQDSDFTPFDEIRMTMNPREAFFARKRTVKMEESIGKICGEIICTYPPGVPVVIPGEIITEQALDYLLKVRNQGAFISGASDPQLSSIVICIV